MARTVVVDKEQDSAPRQDMSPRPLRPQHRSDLCLSYALIAVCTGPPGVGKGIIHLDAEGLFNASVYNDGPTGDIGTLDGTV